MGAGSMLDHQCPGWWHYSSGPWPSTYAHQAQDLYYSKTKLSCLVDETSGTWRQFLIFYFDKSYHYTSSSHAWVPKRFFLGLHGRTPFPLTTWWRQKRNLFLFKILLAFLELLNFHILYISMLPNYFYKTQSCWVKKQQQSLGDFSRRRSYSSSAPASTT